MWVGSALPKVRWGVRRCWGGVRECGDGVVRVSLYLLSYRRVELARPFIRLEFATWRLLLFSVLFFGRFEDESISEGGVMLRRSACCSVVCDCLWTLRRGWARLESVGDLDRMSQIWIV